jgi:glycosyltransferase involved in cell wall biosynthesis
MLLRRQLFLEMGGFDQENLAVAYNDIDLCLRLRERGFRSVFAPRAELVHYEGNSRGFTDNPMERRAYRLKWGHDRDPFYNPHLSRDHDRFTINTRRLIALETVPQLPIRALFCSDNLNLEESSYVQYEIALGLKERGRITAEICSPTDGPLASLYRQAGIPVHILPDPVRDVPMGAGYDGRLQSFADWMRDQDFAVVHANTLNCFFAVDAAKRAALPSLWSVRESVDWHTYFDQFGRELVDSALRSFAYAYRVVFAAGATRNLFAPLATQHNFSVIHSSLRRNALDCFRATHSVKAARALLDCPHDKTVITIIGPVCERKGQHDFARAALEILRHSHRNVVFNIVGCSPSPYLDTLKNLVRDHSADIRLIPETDKVYAYLRASDVLVCCSSNESYPRVIQEAMAFQLAIVTTPVFGILEQVTPGASALTYPVGDVNALVKQLRYLLDHSSERERLAKGALAALDTLTNYEEMVEAYEQLFLEAFMAADKPMQQSYERAPLHTVNSSA